MKFDRMRLKSAVAGALLCSFAGVGANAGQGQMSLDSSKNANAPAHRDLKLSALKYLDDIDAKITLTEPILIPKGQKEVVLHHGDWTCIVRANDEDSDNDRRVIPREIGLTAFSNSRISESHLRSYVWYFGSASSGLTYTETSHELIFFLRDLTLNKVKCIGPKDQDTLGDLEEVIKPFDLGIPQSVPSQDTPRPEAPKPPVDA